MAARAGQTGVVKYLVQNGTHVDAKSKVGLLNGVKSPLTAFKVNITVCNRAIICRFDTVILVKYKSKHKQAGTLYLPTGSI